MLPVVFFLDESTKQDYKGYFDWLLKPSNRQGAI
jgi:hypothetical protein